MKNVKKISAMLALAATALMGQVAPAEASVNGTTSSQGAVVQLWGDSYKSSGRLCSGTHIGKGWVLTAKHCVEEVGIQARYGSVVWGTTKINWNERMKLDQKNAKITRIVTNSDSKKDMALVKVDGLAWDRQAPTLPLASHNRPEELANAKCTAYGYGIWTEHDNSNAALPWNQRSVNFTITRATSNISSSTSAQLEGKGANGAYLNTGDSGGALVCNGKLSGVTVALMTSTKTNTFMSISGSDRTWIKNVTGI